MFKWLKRLFKREPPKQWLPSDVYKVGDLVRIYPTKVMDHYVEHSYINCFARIVGISDEYLMVELELITFNFIPTGRRYASSVNDIISVIPKDIIPRITRLLYYE
jgi:hypothetical protein